MKKWSRRWKEVGLSMLFYPLSISPVGAQNVPVTVSGSVQHDMLLSTKDDAGGDDVMFNTYVDAMLQSKNVDAGVRFEYMEHPLPGFADPPEEDFKGWGLPHFWVKGRLGCAELTGGTFYEQFGSGFILRSYEERSLGLDNSLLGGRLVLKPVKGLTLKALAGTQRHYWRWDGGVVSGADAEVSLDEWLPSLQRHDMRLALGGSWVNKWEKDEDIFADATHRYNLPLFVNAWDGRLHLDKGAWSLLAEYAHKTQDPSYANEYSYDEGHAAMLSGSYSKRGLSVLLQAKRSENMAFRSKRTVMGAALPVNHLPAFTLDHTYALAALYPYATQLATGEWAYQAEVGYNIKRKTALGGKYGMNVKVNYSYVRAIQDAWLKWGADTYYQDLNIQLTRRLSRDFKLNVMYMNQRYNQRVIERHVGMKEGDDGMIHADIFVADGMLQVARKAKLRGELQYLSTKDDQGDWAYGLLELSLAPHWMFTAADLWNCGDTKKHYYQALVTYNVKSHRLQVGYGRTRAGYNCAGGVCRYVPETEGVTLAYNCTF